MSVISFNFCTSLLWLFIQQILKAIWKSWYWHQHWHCKILFFPFKFFWKVKHEQYNSWAHLFGTSITLLQLLIYLWSSFHPPRSNHYCCREKGSLKFWSTQPLAFQKKSCHENFSKLPKNIRFGVLNLSTFSCIVGVRETTRLERFMSVYTCKRKHAWEILGMGRGVCMRLHASYGKAWIIYILFLDQRCMCCSMKKTNIKGPIRSEI